MIRKLTKKGITGNTRRELQGLYRLHQHKSKAETPTMGGFLILLTLLISTLLWARLDNRLVLLMVFSVASLGTLGFIDDFIKLTRKRSLGLKMLPKLSGQLILAAAIVLYLYHHPHSSHIGDLTIPFIKDFFLPLSLIYIPFAILVIVGTSNAVNLTDGLDGLAIGPVTIAAATFAVLSYLTGNVKFSEYLKIIYIPEAGELTVFCAALVGAGLGFLWYNAYPAQLFMGDTGSLALGGALGILALLVKKELLLVIIGGLFVLETVSVIIQIMSFRLRKGKRVFRMTPLHHHFEIRGWAEPKVTVRFWIISVILALISLGSLKLR
jgi:phospho-N-acetylmuramoyl-pentapeptide-transferase